MEHIADLLMIPVQVIIVFYTLYYFVLALSGLIKKEDKTMAPPEHTFAAVICAHNEETVVGELIDNSEGTQLSAQYVRYLCRCR